MTSSVSWPSSPLAAPVRPSRADPSPAGLVAGDAEGDLAHDLVGEGHGAGVEAAGPDVAVEALQLAGLEEGLAAGHVDGDVDDALGALAGPVPGRQDLHGPTLAVVHTGVQVGRHPVDHGPHGVELEVHLGDPVLDHRVIGERAPLDADRGLRLAASTASSNARSAIPT